MAEPQFDAGRLSFSPRSDRTPRPAMTFTPVRSQLIVLIPVAVVAVLLRLIPVAIGTGTDRFMDPNGDSRAYVELSRGLRHGCGFARFADGYCLDAETNRTPGYPLFLAASPDIRIALMFQALLGGIVSLTAGAFVGSLWGYSSAAICAILIAFDLPSLVLSNEIMTEAHFTALFALAIIVELSALRTFRRTPSRVVLILMASALFACAIIVRPIGEFAVVAGLSIPLLAAAIPWRQRIGYALITISIPIALVAGWSARNYRVSGKISFSSIGGLNFFYYRAGGTLAYASGKTWQGELGKLAAPNQSQLVQPALAIIAHHPLAFARMTAWSLFYVCTVPERGPLNHLLGIQHSFPAEEPGSMRLAVALRESTTSPALAIRTIYRDEFQSSAVVLALTVFQILMTIVLWVGVLAAMRSFGLRSYRRFCLTSLMLTAFVLLILAAGPEATARFRVPAIPLLAMVAGIGLSAGHINKLPARVSRARPATIV